ncbi:hypothetical protein [Candidatus Poriferisodalis sp.]|uniref:hypothetical protein n=1 Tax=Candidatus Poriferisodalis sp. TaxID=3101277 RepID=UPI003B02AEDC
MPFAYSPEYREMVLSLVRAGREVAGLAGVLEVGESTVHRWKAQDQIDRGARRGTATSEGAELEDACGEVADMKLVSRIMREHGISGLPKRRRRKRSCRVRRVGHTHRLRTPTTTPSSRPDSRNPSPTTGIHAGVPPAVRAGQRTSAPRNETSDAPLGCPP